MDLSGAYGIMWHLRYQMRQKFPVIKVLSFTSGTSNVLVQIKHHILKHLFFANFYGQPVYYVHCTFFTISKGPRERKTTENKDNIHV